MRAQAIPVLESFTAWDLNKILASDVNEFPENQLEVTYSSGMLNIELPENITQYSINILNLNGQLIANFKENSNSGIIEKNLSICPPEFISWNCVAAE
jgi:hypothetical protein